METKAQAYLRRARERRDAARERLGGACASCGSTERLEFDHVDPSTKRFNIARYTKADDAEFWAEIAKCQLLCSPCHHTKTQADGSYGPVPDHGTLSRYVAPHRCRCQPCRAESARYARERRRA